MAILKLSIFHKKKRSKIACFNVRGLSQESKRHHQSTLLLVINKELKAMQKASAQLGLPPQLKTISDLRQLETLATDRKRWMSIVQCAADMQVTEPQFPIIRVQPHRDAKQ